MLSNWPKIHVWSKSPEKTSKYVKRPALQNGYLGFSKLCILPQNFQKNIFGGKTYKKNKKLLEFSKKQNIYYEAQYLLCQCQILRQSVSFWSQNCQTNRENYIWQKNWLHFLEVLDHLQKNTTVKFAVKNWIDRHQFCFKRPTSKFDLVWPDLTWPQPELHPNVIQII